MEIKKKIIDIFKRTPKDKEWNCPKCKIKAFPTSKKKEHFFCEKCNSVYTEEEVENGMDN